MHLQNRARFIASTIFTIFVLAAIIYMTLNLIFGKSSGVSTIAKSLPVMVILVDGGDRVLRYFIDLIRQFKLQRRLQKTGEIPTGLKPYMEISHRERESDSMERLELKPYKIVASVYQIEEEWDSILENLKPFKDRLFLVDDASPDNTYDIVKKSGVEIIRNPENTNKPGAVYYGVQNLPPEIETVVVIDPDIILSEKESVEKAVYDLQQSDAGGCAVYVLPECTEHASRIVKCQAVEYEFSMYCGREVPHNYVIASGAFAIFNRNALQQALAESSRHVIGEDYETSLMIILNGWRTYFDNRVLVRTEVPSSLRKFTRQRIGWNFGFARVITKATWQMRKCKDPFFRYQFYIYNLGITLLFHPFRVFALAVLCISLFAFIFGPLSPVIARFYTLPISFIALVIGFYMFMALEGFAGSLTLKKKDFMIIFYYPLFSFYQNFVPITIGYLNFITWITVGTKLVNDPYEPRRRKRRECKNDEGNY